MASSWIHYPEQGLIIILLIAANAFFVAAEFAFVKIRRSQLKSMRVKGKKDWRLGLAIRVPPISTVTCRPRNSASP